MTTEEHNGKIATSHRLNHVLFGLLGVFVVVALGLGLSALLTANHADDHSAAVDRRTAYELAKVDHARAITACRRSKDLNALLNNLDETLNLGASTNPKTLAAHKLLVDFTTQNPNCRHIPPKPVKP